MRRAPWASLVTLVVGAAIGCSEGPTSISIVTTTDLPCAALKGVTIRANSPGATDGPSTTTLQCSDGAGESRIGTLVLVPSGDNDAKVSVRVMAGVDKPVADCDSAPGQAGCIVAKRALRFVAGHEIELPIVLRAQCKGTPCDPTSTCVSGVCRSATVNDPTLCSGSACDEGSLEARGSGPGNGPANDAGSPTLPDGGAVTPDSGIIVLPDGGITCGASEKICNGACVSQADPTHGCSSVGCEACAGSDVGDYACAGGKCVRLNCKPGFKLCGDTCVPTDVAHGCSAAACAACDATNGTPSCDGSGACAITCANNYKLCAGKCVNVDDPTYGCGPTSCSAAGCPTPGQGGTLICSGGACVIGSCPGGTKQCGQKCVPTDTVNGCQDPGRCTACGPFDQCLGAPTVCTCVPESDATACSSKGAECGSVTNRCGGTVGSCGGCAAPQTCGGAGVANKCGCTDEPAKTSCDRVGARCGSVQNNCKRLVNCDAVYGSCPAQTGKSAAYCAGNACACTPADPNAVCPSYGCANPDDGCGGYVDCYNYYCCGCGGGA